MKRQSIDIEGAKAAAGGYDYVIGTTISEMIIGDTSCIAGINWDEILDMRFFSENRELHVFRDGGLRAVAVQDESGDDFGTRKVQTDKTVPGAGAYKELIFKEYYCYDDDGQIKVEYTRPVSLK